MSQRATQKAASRQAIVQSAAAILRGGGIAGTSVHKAMAGAGLTVGAFYAHFSDKDELLGEAFEQALGEAVALVNDAASGQRGHVALVAVIDRYLSEEHRDQFSKGCPLPAAMGEAASSDPGKMRTLLVQGVETMQQKVAAAGTGEIAAERSLALVALMVGGQILARATQGTPISSSILRACREAGAELVTPKRRSQ